MSPNAAELDYSAMYHEMIDLDPRFNLSSIPMERTKEFLEPMAQEEAVVELGGVLFGAESSLIFSITGLDGCGGYPYELQLENFAVEKDSFFEVLREEEITALSERHQISEEGIRVVCDLFDILNLLQLEENASVDTGLLETVGTLVANWEKISNVRTSHHFKVYYPQNEIAAKWVKTETDFLQGVVDHVKSTLREPFNAPQNEYLHDVASAARGAMHVAGTISGSLVGGVDRFVRGKRSE